MTLPAQPFTYLHYPDCIWSDLDAYHLCPYCMSRSKKSRFFSVNQKKDDDRIEGMLISLQKAIGIN